MSSAATARTAAREQILPGSDRYMSTVFWDLFTGSASYRSTSLRAFHPRLLGRLAREGLGGAARPLPAVGEGLEND